MFAECGKMCRIAVAVDSVAKSRGGQPAAVRESNVLKSWGLAEANLNWHTISSLDQRLMFRALVVEDDPGVCGCLQNALSRLGWRVSVSVTATEAIESLRQASFDAVFAELCLRECGGRTIARWIKSQGAQTRMFILTSWRGELEPSLLRLDGIHSVVRKPLIFNEIRDILLEHFG
jgi:CheY-like chemotaxis protein